MHCVDTCVSRLQCVLVWTDDLSFYASVGCAQDLREAQVVGTLRLTEQHSYGMTECRSRLDDQA